MAEVAPAVTVVLMHGFGAFMHLLANVSIRPMVAALSGVNRSVHAPMVQAYDTVPQRAARWMQHLRRIRGESSTNLHLIGFSSGGLDARYVITRLGGHEIVASLTTISAPHHGSSLAEFVLDTPRPVRKGLVGFADWMGDRLGKTDRARAGRALEELTAAFVNEEFNPSTPDHPDVIYRSWAGRAGKGTNVPILPVLSVPNRIIYKREGQNDGIVSVSSAIWSGFQGTIDADHARQIGVQLMNGTFDATSFVSSLVDGLAA